MVSLVITRSIVIFYRAVTPVYQVGPRGGGGGGEVSPGSQVSSPFTTLCPHLTRRPHRWVKASSCQTPTTLLSRFGGSAVKL